MIPISVYGTRKQHVFAKIEGIAFHKLSLSFLFACLTGIGAMIKFYTPFTPVPITMQVFFVLLSGALLGRYYGSLSQIMYVGLGMAGISWFANPAALFGITGGYLIGFIVAPYIVDLFKEKSMMLAMLMGIGVIYLFGAIQFYLLTSLPLNKVFMLAVMPFIGIDIAKAFAAAGAIKIIDAFHLRF